MSILNGVILAMSEELPPFNPLKMYEYVIGGNGLFIRAQRRGLCALIPLNREHNPHLMNLAPEVRLQELAPASILREVLCQSRKATPLEALFYLLPDPWQLVAPGQCQTKCSVHPINPYSEEGINALIEIHSHNDMDAFWSSTDNHDETGFRIYGVIGRVSTKVQIKFRVGIYGHFFRIPTAWVFDLAGKGHEDA